MRLFSKSNKIKQDFKDLETCIDQMTQEQLEEIRKKTKKIRKQAERTGEDVEAALEESTKKKG